MRQFSSRLNSRFQIPTRLLVTKSSRWRIPVSQQNSSVDIQSPATREAILKKQLKARNLTGALATLTELEESQVTVDVSIYNEMMLALRKARKWNEVLELYDRMKRNGIEFREGTFVILIKTAGALQNLDLAIELFREVESSSNLELNHRVFGAMIDVCVNLGKLEKARNYLSEMKTVLGRTTVIAYTLILSGYAKLLPKDPSVLESVDQLLSEMKSDGLVANVYIYAVLLKIYGTIGQFDKMRELLREMGKLRIKPDAAICNTVLFYMGNSMTPGEANQMYLEMVEQQGVKPDEYTCNLLLRVFAKGGDSVNARAFVRKMKQMRLKITTITYNTLIQSYISGSKSDTPVRKLSVQCDQLLTEMKNSGLKPDLFTYNSLLAACSLCGDHERAVGYLVDMERQKIKPTATTYTSLIDLYSRYGNPEDRRQYLNSCFALLEQMEMNQVPMDTRVFASLINACAQVRDSDQALKLLSKMKSKGLSRDKYIYNSMIRLWTAMKNTDEAFSTFDTMVAKGVKPDVVTFTVMFQMLSEQNDNVNILKLLERMEEFNLKPNEVTKRVIRRLDKDYLTDEITQKLEQQLNSD